MFSKNNSIDFTPFPMYGYNGKYWGYAITIISLLLYVVKSIFQNFAAIFDAENTVVNEVLLWSIGFGLYTIAFSKEKNDDERVRLIRYQSLRIAMGTMLSFIFAIGITNTFSPMNFENNVFFQMYSSFMMGVVWYLFNFYRGLLFDADFVYSDNTVKVNLIKNKKYFIYGYLIPIALLLIVLLFNWVFA